MTSNSQKMASKVLTNQNTVPLYLPISMQEREVQDYASRLALMRSNRKSSSSSSKPVLESQVDSGAKVRH